MTIRSPKVESRKLPLVLAAVLGSFVAFMGTAAQAQPSPKPDADQTAAGSAPSGTNPAEQPAAVAPAVAPNAVQTAPMSTGPAPTSSPIEPTRPAPTSPFMRQNYEINSTGWKATIYGFAEADFIHDSTRSFPDSHRNAAIARTTMPATGLPNYASQVGRDVVHHAQLTLRRAAGGARVRGLEAGGAVLEVDFMANPGRLQRQHAGRRKTSPRPRSSTTGSFGPDTRT